MQIVENFLHIVAGALHYPVLLGLAALVFYLLALGGGLAREWLDRRQGRRLRLARFGDELAQLLATTAVARREVEIAALLQRCEHDMDKPLERVRFVVRAGPGVGLMGTLIPMGEALAALAGGGMPSMAGHMLHAFNSAVIGLGAGVAAFAIALVREQWLRADGIEMRYQAERALAGDPVGNDGVVASMPGMPVAES